MSDHQTLQYAIDRGTPPPVGTYRLRGETLRVGRARQLDFGGSLIVQQDPDADIAVFDKGFHSFAWRNLRTEFEATGQGVHYRFDGGEGGFYFGEFTGLWMRRGRRGFSQDTKHQCPVWQCLFEDIKWEGLSGAGFWLDGRIGNASNVFRRIHGYQYISAPGGSVMVENTEPMVRLVGQRGFNWHELTLEASHGPALYAVDCFGAFSVIRCEWFRTTGSYQRFLSFAHSGVAVSAIDFGCDLIRVHPGKAPLKNPGVREAVILHAEASDVKVGVFGDATKWPPGLRRSEGISP